MAFTQVIKTLGSVMESMKTAVDTWLSQNITNPSNPPLDRSLSLSNACAPADMVGELKNEIHNNLSCADLERYSWNVFHMHTTSSGRHLSIVFPSEYLTRNKSARIYAKTAVGTTFNILVYEVSDYDTNTLGTRIANLTSVNPKIEDWLVYDVSSMPLTRNPETDYVAILLFTNTGNSINDLYLDLIQLNGIVINPYVLKTFVYGVNIGSNEYTEKLTSMDIFNYLLTLRNFKNITNGKILCIGDSLTAGVYASDNQVHTENYPYYMKQIVSNEVINKGMPGYSASMYWNNNIMSTIDFTNVKLIIIMLGTNGGLTDTLDIDVFPYTDYNEYASTKTGCYCKIIEYCMEHAPTAEIYLCTTPFYNKDLVPQFAPPNTPNANAVIPKIAEYYNFSIIDVRHGMGINQKNTLIYQSDGLHGDSQFYQKLGTFIGSQLKSKASFII